MDDLSQPLPNKAARSPNIYLAMPPSGGQSWVTVYIAGSKNEVVAFLTFAKGDSANQFYEALMDEKDEINRDIGIPLAWESDGDKHKIVSRLDVADIRPKDNEEKLLEYYSDTINRYVNAFRLQLQRLTETYGK